MRQVNLSTFNNWGRTLYFGGGASPPPAPPPVTAPPKPDTPDNSTSQAAAKKKGLQSTLLTGAGAGLGGSQSTLGSSTPPAAFGGQMNAYGGES